MKTIITTILCSWSLCMCLCDTVNAANYTWTGTNNTSWNNSENWSPAGIPSTNDNVTIGSTTIKPSLTGNTTIKKLTMTGDTLNLLGDTLTVSDDATLSGGNIKNGHLKITSGNAIYSGTSFDVTISAVCVLNKFNGSTFNYNCTFENTSNNNVNSDGGCTFNGNVKYIKSGTGLGYNNLGNTTGNTFNGTLEIENHGTREIQLSDVGTNNYNGNLMVSSVGSGGIYFGSTNGGTSLLATGKTIAIGTGGFTDGTLLFRNFTQSGSTASTFSITSNSVVNIISSTFNASLTFTAPSILLKDNTFNGKISLTQTGTVRTNSDGGNTFNDSIIVVSKGSGIIRLGNTSNDNFNGNALLKGDSSTIQIAYGSTAYFRGNINCYNDVNFKAGTAAINFTGTATQTITGSGTYEFKNLTINKASNNIIANAILKIDGTLSFVKGKIINSSGYVFIINDSASYSGVSDSSFISGPVKKKGNTAFVFPIGKGNYHRALEITAPSVGTDAFTAEYFDSGQTLGTSMDTTIDYLSPCNYWNIERTTGTSNVYVKLNWNASSCSVLDSADLRIAQWNGTKWLDKGYGSFTGTKTTGKLASPSAISSFNYFTLAYKTTPLPTAILGNDTLLNGDSFTLTGTSNTHIRWYPDFHLSCDTCLSTTVDTLVTSVKYFLVATDYKGRVAVDSIYLHTLHKFSSINHYFPPQLDWKANDWTLTNPFTLDPQTQDESGDEWWYGHENSFNIPSPSTEPNGYICAGYSSFVNQEYFVSGDCYQKINVWNDGADCADMELPGTSSSNPGRHRGVFRSAMGLKPLNGKGYTWFKNYGVGFLLNVIQTSDGGYLAVGFARSTVNVETGSPIIYNPVSNGSGGSTGSTFSCPIPYSFPGKACVIKVDADGNLLWQYLYAPFSNVLTAEPFTVIATNLVETPSGDFKVIGRYRKAINPGIYESAAFIMDLDEIGNLKVNGGYPGYLVLPDVIGNNYTNDVYAWGITSYTYDSETKYIVSGYGQKIHNQNPFYIPQKAYVMQLDEDNNLEWSEVNMLNSNNGITLNSTSHYVKIVKNVSPPEILVPIVEQCSGCNNSGENSGSGSVYKLDIYGNLMSGFPVNIGSVDGYDLRVNVAPTEDGGFAALSIIHNNIQTQAYDCEGVYFEKPNTSFDVFLPYWNTDVFVAKYDNAGVEEWKTTWNIDDLSPLPFPKDVKKQECVYTITQSSDLGFVIAGNSSYNLDDFYVCKLKPDCDAHIATDPDIHGFYNIYNVTGNEPWSSSKTVFGSVHVKNGGILTISGSSTVIKFSDSKMVSLQGMQAPVETNIVVEPGGKLYINDYATLTVYDDCNGTMWDGIQVWGTPASNPSTGQGYVEITNATIANARIGILADKTYRSNTSLATTFLSDGTEEAIPLGTFGGGIVKATGVEFVNNRYSIWFSPYSYVNSSVISGCTFTSDAILQDDDYFAPFKPLGLYKTGSLEFIRMNSTRRLKVYGNVFNANSTLADFLRGTAIVMFDSHADIKDNTLNDLTYGIKCRYSVYLNSTLFARDNFFNNNQFGIFQTGGAFASIYGNRFMDIPDGTIGNQRYGCWMFNAPGYVLASDNVFLGVNSTPVSNIGFVSTNSQTLGGTVAHNEFSDLAKGVQAERNNANVSFSCNSFSNHNNAWNICPLPHSDNAFPDQGTGTGLTDKRAGNVFNDAACTTTITEKHIKSSVAFTYYGNSAISGWVPTCVSTGVNVDGTYSDPDDESCDPEIDPCPTCIEELREAFENSHDEIEKQNYANAVVRYYLNDTTEEWVAVFDFLHSLNTLESRIILLSLYIQDNNLDSVHSCYEAIRDDITLDDITRDFYALLVDLADSSKNLTEITDTQAELLQVIANDTNSRAQFLAQTALAIARDSLYFYEPEDEDDTIPARLMQPQLVEAHIDNMVLENFPNPYKDETIIKVIAEGKENELKIIDVFGKQIFNQALKTGYNEIVFSSVSVPAGIYYFSIISNGSVVKTKRMCIIK